MRSVWLRLRDDRRLLTSGNRRCLTVLSRRGERRCVVNPTKLTYNHVRAGRRTHDLQTEAIVLQFMHPARPKGRPLRNSRPAGMNETGRRIRRPASRATRHTADIKQPAPDPQV